MSDERRIREHVELGVDQVKLSMSGESVLTTLHYKHMKLTEADN